MNVAVVILYYFGIADLRQIGADIIRSSSNPATGKVMSGQSWSFECEVPSSSSVVWYKRVGDLVTKVGYDNLNNKDFLSASQFILDKDVASNVTKYSLRLISARLEDSGIYQCVSPSQSTSKESSTFITCDDVTKSYCDCMFNHGWANPECFSTFQEEVDGIEDEYKSTLVGLLITLGITCLYVVIVVIIYGRDFFMMISRKRQLKKMQKHALKNVIVPCKAGKIFELKGVSDTTRLDPKGGAITFEGQSESSGYCGSQASSKESDLKKDKPLPQKDTTSHSNEAFCEDVVAHKLVEVPQVEVPLKWNIQKSKSNPGISTLAVTFAESNVEPEIEGTMV